MQPLILSSDNTFDSITIDISSSLTTYTQDVMTSMSYGSDTITLNNIDLGMNMDWVNQQIIYDEYREEKEIRERNEGVQKAWEQYKIMVVLAKMPPEIPEE